MTTRTAPPTRRRFSVEDYYRMAEAGILSPHDRVELIDGEVVEMAPIGHWHGFLVDLLNRLFNSRFSDVAIIRVQGSVRLNDYAEPQPDLALLRLPPDRYRNGNPTPADIFLLIEVADTLIAYDRGVKALAYARSGVPEYLVLERETITLHRDPTPDGYGAIVGLPSPSPTGRFRWSNCSAKPRPQSRRRVEPYPTVGVHEWPVTVILRDF